jgi:hypothetical protein
MRLQAPPRLGFMRPNNRHHGRRGGSGGAMSPNGNLTPVAGRCDPWSRASSQRRASAESPVAMAQRACYSAPPNMVPGLSGNVRLSARLTASRSPSLGVAAARGQLSRTPWRASSEHVRRQGSAWQWSPVQLTLSRTSPHRVPLRLRSGSAERRTHRRAPSLLPTATRASPIEALVAPHRPEPTRARA